MAGQLKDRVQRLVDHNWGGSVNRAATRLGVPQQTLQRIVSGQTLNPRVSVLERIATGCNTSVDWLLNGRGSGPLESDDKVPPLRGGFLRLRAALARMEATDQLRAALGGLTWAPFRAARLSVKRGAKAGTVFAAADAASDATAEAWASFLEATVGTLGAKKAGANLADVETAAALGFTDFGIWLAQQPGTAKRYEEYCALLAGTQKSLFELGPYDGLFGFLGRRLLG